MISGSAARGSRSAASSTYAWASPDLDLPGVDIDSRTLFATLEASYPFIRRQTRTRARRDRLRHHRSGYRVQHIPLNRDRLRVAFARIAFDALGLAAGRSALHAGRAALAGRRHGEVRQGLDMLGASQGCGPGLAACFAPGAVPPTRLEGDPTATVLRGTRQGEWRPMPELTFALDAARPV